MSICVSPDSLDWSKVHHMRNVAASNALLARLHEHHGNGEPVAATPAEANHPEPISEPALIVSVVAEPARIEPEDRDWLFVTPRPVTTIKDIQRVVAKHYGFSCMDMRSKRRTAALAKARHVAMFVAKSVTPRSLPEIGYYFGGRDHTTVLHGVRKIGSMIEADESFRDEVAGLKAQFEAAP